MQTLTLLEDIVLSAARVSAKRLRERVLWCWSGWVLLKRQNLKNDKT